MTARRSIRPARGRLQLAPPLLFAALLLAPARARAQSTTFYLDRLQIAGAPDDGQGVWRPRFGSTRVYGQLALGYARNPLRIDNLVDDRNKAETLSGPPVANQLTTYATVGGEILERGAVQITFPLVVAQNGSPLDNAAVGLRRAVRLASVAPSDLRIDGRLALAQSESGAFTLGARAALFLPLGDELSFAGDLGTWSNIGLSTGLDAGKLVVTLNAGVSLRPTTRLNQLTVGSELTVGLAAYVPFLQDQLRLGAELLGSVGLLPATAGELDASPLEGSLNGRLFTDPKHRVWVGLGAGTRLTGGYAPDFRAVALVGGAFAFDAADAAPGAAIDGLREAADTDKDGLPDLVDPCPVEPEDHALPDAEDGCPRPPDRDGDDILDPDDRCREQPEDKDGLDDADGCPEDDADADGTPDAADRCPKEPGVHGEDPQKEGCPQFIRRPTKSTEVELLKEIEFESGNAILLPKSDPILDEVVRLLKVNPEIEQVIIEGHTDNVGATELNQRLSYARASAVNSYLVERGGIAPARLSFKGSGSAKPRATNDTPEGRAKNRRVEFHLVYQEASGQ